MTTTSVLAFVLSLLVLAPALVPADFTKNQLRDLYLRQAGDSSCPQSIRFQDDELQLEADEIQINQQMCTGGFIRLRQSPTEGHAFATHFNTELVSNAIGPFLAGNVRQGNIVCGDVQVPPGTFFTIFQPRRDYLITWFKVVGNGSGLENATDTMFTFKADVVYLLIDDRCLYNPGDLDTEGDQSDRACFPAHATVQLQDGRTRRMHQLRIGDRVQVAEHKFAPIFAWTHRIHHSSFPFITLHLSNNAKLTVSSQHYLYVNGRAQPTVNVRIDDRLPAANGSTLYVKRIEHTRATGLYNPQTVHGDIVVNGVVVTTYTSAVPLMTAHALLAPVRAAFCAASALFPSALSHLV